MSQVVIFYTNGEVFDTCDTLLTIDRKTSIFDQFDFLKSIEELFPGLPVGEKLVFDAVEWNQQTSGLYALEFEKVDDTRVHWIILDNTKEQEQIIKVQQARNESAINEEFLEIQRKYLEMEKSLLDYKNQELNRVQKFKAQFFAEVSHEMRTPLNSISGLIDLLKSGKQDSEKYLEALKATSQHLNAIINDVLDLSKIEAGKFELIDKPFELKKSIEQITSGFAMLAKDKGIELNVNVHASVPNAIIGDQVRISQVIYNLLGNALKFTSAGSVGIEVKARLIEGAKHNIQFSITDTGFGMSQEDIDRLLEPYAQIEGQDFRQFGGTGLGLGIANQLITLMGGQLIIKSKLGKGTNMAFDLEFQEGEKLSDDGQIQSIDLSHLNVLVAEDDALSQTILKSTLEQAGAQCQFVARLDTFEEALLSYSHNVILADINLADGSSTDVLIRLKEKLNVPIIFLSGDAESTLPALKQLDNWQFLMKPIDSAELMELLKKIDKPVEIDLANLKAVTQNDVRLMKELIGIISETLPAELERLEDALKLKDFKMAKKVLHKINPSISYFGIQDLINQRKAMYEWAHEGKFMTGFDNFKATIEEALQQLVAIKDSMDS